MASKSTDKASRGIFSYANALKGLNRSAFPLAVRGTLNGLAFETRQNLSTVQMPKKFTLRNTFENKKSLRYDRSENTFDIKRMKSAAGQMRTVNFQRGPKQTEDLFTQELGRMQRPRQGKSFVRTPTLEARTGKAFNRPVAKANRPSTDDKWLSVDEVAKVAGIKTAGQQLNKDAKIKRAYALARKYPGKFNGRKIVIPAKAGKKYVYKVKRGRLKLLHVLSPNPRRLKKRETVKPAFQEILRTRADQIFREQADRRVKAHIKKSLLKR